MEIKQKYTALQLVGSPTSQFFFDLSLLYAKAVVQPKDFERLFVIAYPDGSWSVQEQLSQKTSKLTFVQMIETVRRADVVVPHLFCQKGLTTWRIFFEDVLQIPMVGSSGHTLSIAQNKQLTKFLAAAAGVRVPKGICVTSTIANDAVLKNLNFPVIVKPNKADNSDGLALVRTLSELEVALTTALQFDEEVLIEEFIEGREIRGAIIETNGQFQTLPFIEYQVTESHPIRVRTDKLKFGAKGELLDQSEKREVPAQCPANITSDFQTTLSEMMIQMHQKLDCRDFSMYDFRIHEATGQAYLLEAGLFWSFSKTSMISAMLEVGGEDLKDITRSIWQQAMARGKSIIH